MIHLLLLSMLLLLAVEEEELLVLVEVLVAVVLADTVHLSKEKVLVVVLPQNQLSQQQYNLIQ
jgi:hypothetical protein